MNIIDIVFLGWYRILDKTIYLYRIEQGGIGPKEHAFFITFLLHGINLWSLFRYLSFEYFGFRIDWWLLIGIVVLGIGYFFYYRRERLNKILLGDINSFKFFLYIMFALIYTIFSVYIMLKLGDYIRSKLHGD
jgi:1,4-dihydroxy-2-naphthoate octaprenyltransferase